MQDRSANWKKTRQVISYYTTHMLTHLEEVELRVRQSEFRLNSLTTIFHLQAALLMALGASRTSGRAVKRHADHRPGSAITATLSRSIRLPRFQEQRTRTHHTISSQPRRYGLRLILSPEGFPEHRKKWNHIQRTRSTTDCILFLVQDECTL